MRIWGTLAALALATMAAGCATGAQQESARMQTAAAASREGAKACQATLVRATNTRR